MRKVLNDGIKILVAMLADLLREAPVTVPSGRRAIRMQWFKRSTPKSLGAAILSKLAANQRPLERALNNTQARLIADAPKGETQ